jgi:probable F420-dependent oxidoreductase
MTGAGLRVGRPRHRPDAGPDVDDNGGMSEPRDPRTMLGPVGVWANLDGIPIDDALRYARLAESLGYGAFWVNESVGREPFAMLGALARETRSITLGVGIASTYARDPVAAHSAARTIADVSGGRFVMGLGISHRTSVALRGDVPYGPPLATMRAYLDGYEAAPWRGPAVAEPPLVIAALGPGMLALAAQRTAGGFPYLVTPEQVQSARVTLDDAAVAAGRDTRPLLVVTQIAILGDPADVRATARRGIAGYLTQPNYRNNLVRGGFAEADIDAASDALVDALVATGDAGTVRARLAAHAAAGADHVAVIALSADGRQADADTIRALAPR